MNVEEIIMQSIGDFGFPIGAFLLMWQFATRTLKENTKAITDLCLTLKPLIK